MKLFKLLFFICMAINFSNLFAQSNYIRIENGKFKDGDNAFTPYSVNYLVMISQNCTTGEYFLEPNPQHSTDWGYPNTAWLYPLESYNCESGKNMYSSTDEQGVGMQKILDDMAYLKNKGFNVIRLVIQTPSVDKETNQKINIPTGSYSTYFNLLEQCLDIIQSYGFRVILNLGIDSNIKDLTKYDEILKRMGAELKDNKTLMAFSLLSEPFYGFHVNDKNDKILIGNWVNEMYYALKRESPNHLITIGLQHPETVINWDYGMMNVDFISIHAYAWRADVDYSNRMLTKYYKFLFNNCKLPWIIAETGYSGTDIASSHDITTGTEQNQLDFANYNMQKAQDCGCLGYGWWDWQDLGFGSNWENNLGLVTRWPKEKEKKAIQAFNNMTSITPNPANCTTPENYLNMSEGTTYKLYGYVKDENNNPIKDALVYGWCDGDGNYKVLTDQYGRFNFYTNGGDPYMMYISALGYDALKLSNPKSGETYKLREINKNNWTKRYTNNTDNTLLGWTFTDDDQLYKGDFNGDGKDELLCIQNNNSDGCWATMFSYDNGKWQWGWSNYGNNSIGGWYIRSFDKYLVGDFDGDGKDELQCIQVTSGSNNYATTLNFENGNWNYAWSNYGNNSIGGWYIRSFDKYLVGDFDGDGKDEILCYQNTDTHKSYSTMINFDHNQWNWGWSNSGNGWIGEWRLMSSDKLYTGDFDGDGKDELICAQTTGSNDWITFQNFDNGNWNRLWSNSGNSSVGIYPYRKNLIIGNFDFDDKDEILGVSTWATKFDFDNNNLNWSWSTYGSTLSDWSINQDANLFFIHSIEVAPDYLLVHENKGGLLYSLEMFSINLSIQGNSSYLKSVKKDQDSLQNDEENASDIEGISNLIITYPNPVSNLLNIDLPNDIKYNIDIVDIGGKIIKSVKNKKGLTSMDCSGINSGIYLLRISSDQKIFHQKIVIKQ